MDVRIITPEGVISEEVYTIVEKPDRRHILVVQDKDGQKIRVHQRRTIQPNVSTNSAVAINKSGKFRGICPTCRVANDVKNNKLHCPECNKEYDVVAHGRMVYKKTETSEAPKPRKRTREQPAMDRKVKESPQVEIDELKSAGEVWCKGSCHFDHAMVDVRAFAILADNPPRKLHFNTYNGTLGKKNKALPLKEFRDNETGDDKRVFAVKTALDVEREKLTRKGFTQL